MSSDGLTVAVTGPTGEIGKAFLRALDAEPEVGRVIGMARRPFYPDREGLTKVEYVQGDILDRSSIDDLVKDAGVVVHLAFLIFGNAKEAHEINLEGSRNVFESAFEAGAKRLLYTSSVAAYGFHEDNPDVLTETVDVRGSHEQYYSIQKAEVEALLMDLGHAHPATDLFVFRPCIVAGPTALALVREIPYVKIADKLPGKAKSLLGRLPALRPVVPDPGTPLQLVHEDDVAQALMLASLGVGDPGIYNLAGDGKISVSDIAHALGWYAVPLPDVAVDATARIVSRLPYIPTVVRWGIAAIRVPVLMDCTKAKQELGWAPRYDALETLAAVVLGAREQGLVPWPDRV